ncbi:MAG: tetratricopeptide repeat protein [Omnitrophica bacterium]|nr:tetratricopeptide repeat protein [Candidatus Omnitrophota bacterium]
MKVRKYVISLFLILTFAAPAYCATKDTARLLILEGNARYSEEKFEEAIAEYEKVLSMGYESGPFYYNLGNAYFKHGELGRAILNYLRAARLMPQEADLKANLNYARSLVKNGRVTLGRNWYARLFFALADSFSLDSITFVFMILYFTLALLVILAITKTGPGKVYLYVNSALFAVLIISVSLFAIKYKKEILEKEAVCVVERSDSKFEPSIGGTTFFTLNEGEPITVTASKKDWVKIRRQDGKQGWIKRTDIDLL